MLKRLSSLFVVSLSAMLLFVANSGVSVNSSLVLYEPDIPESLRK